MKKKNVAITFDGDENLLIMYAGEVIQFDKVEEAIGPFRYYDKNDDIFRSASLLLQMYCGIDYPYYPEVSLIGDNKIYSCENYNLMRV